MTKIQNAQIYAHIFTLKNPWRKIFDKLAENFDNI